MGRTPLFLLEAGPAQASWSTGAARGIGRARRSPCSQGGGWRHVMPGRKQPAVGELDAVSGRHVRATGALERWT